jgi:hypothetical protein
MEKHLQHRDEKCEGNERKQYGKNIRKNVQNSITPIRAYIFY